VRQERRDRLGAARTRQSSAQVPLGYGPCGWSGFELQLNVQGAHASPDHNCQTRFGNETDGLIGMRIGLEPHNSDTLARSRGCVPRTSD
jgi:hypothetical protein